MNLFKKIFFLIVFITVFFSCKSVKKVTFKTPVDTTSKEIKTQVKQIFKLTSSGVYASNKFDGARLNGLRKINDSTALVIITPENTPINNSAYYAFSTWADAPRTFYFTFKYPKNYTHRYIPKIKLNNTTTWRVIDSSNVLKKDGIVTIKLKLNKQPLTIAAQEIQSSKDVSKWYTNLARGKDDYVTINYFGKSELGRRLPVLDIYNGDRKNKPIIVLLTRQHPPEVTGYFAFKEFLQTILNNSKLSKNFLTKYRILAFPIMNPDGVDLGHWRHNANGIDLNRDWSEYKQSEIKQTVRFINNTLKKDKTRIILGLDFHSTWHDVFYTNKKRENTTLPHFITDWFKSLEENIPNYKVNEASGNNSKPVSKGWFLHGHNAVGITYEIGDQTPKEKIKHIGKTSAEQMMKILLKTIIN